MQVQENMCDVNADLKNGFIFKQWQKFWLLIIIQQKKLLAERLFLSSLVLSLNPLWTSKNIFTKRVDWSMD